MGPRAERVEVQEQDWLSRWDHGGDAESGKRPTGEGRGEREPRVATPIAEESECRSAVQDLAGHMLGGDVFGAAVEHAFGVQSEVGLGMNVPAIASARTARRARRRRSRACAVR